MKKSAAGGPARISFDLDRELHRRLTKILPYGMQNQALRRLTISFIEAAEEEGEIFLTAVFSGDISLSISQKLRDKLGGRDEG